MNEIDKIDMANQITCRLNEITKIEKYFIKEINERK